MYRTAATVVTLHHLTLDHPLAAAAVALAIAAVAVVTLSTLRARHLARRSWSVGFMAARCLRHRASRNAFAAGYLAGTFGRAAAAIAPPRPRHRQAVRWEKHP